MLVSTISNGVMQNETMKAAAAVQTSRGTSRLMGGPQCRRDYRIGIPSCPLLQRCPCRPSQACAAPLQQWQVGFLLNTAGPWRDTHCSSSC